MRTERSPFSLFISVLVAVVMVFPLAGCLDASVPGDTAVQDELPDLQAELQGKIEDISNNTASLASTIHRLINEERRQGGLQPLQWDPALANIAASVGVRLAFLHSRASWGSTSSR